jgi:hypothetical protein
MTQRITNKNITDTTIIADDLASDSVTNPKIQNSAVTINKFSTPVTLNIIASDGTTVLKTLVTPGV